MHAPQANSYPCYVCCCACTPTQASGLTSVLLPGAQAHAHTLSSCAFSSFCSSDSRILPAHRPPAGRAGHGERERHGRRQAAAAAGSGRADCRGCSVRGGVLSGTSSYNRRRFSPAESFGKSAQAETGACACCTGLQRWIGGARYCGGVAGLRSGPGTHDGDIRRAAWPMWAQHMRGAAGRGVFTASQLLLNTCRLITSSLVCRRNGPCPLRLGRHSLGLVCLFKRLRHSFRPHSQSLDLRACLCSLRAHSPQAAAGGSAAARLTAAVPVGAAPSSWGLSAA